ncbi:hypothetical protein ULG90_02665 [Halopseudomonas pachastrellae]|nr:hypothetical protein ULG90_02665 [Halopseudomonas pachastrellae]
MPRHELALQEVETCRQNLSKPDVALLAAEPDELHAFVDEIQIDFDELHAAISQTYFASPEQLQGSS